MGLDQYLTASEYISRWDWENDVRLENPIFSQLVGQFDVKLPDGHAGITIDFPMGYWRKANQIHNWFVLEAGDGEDNCQEMYVSREQLQELADLCLQVLAVRYTPQGESVAKELLPPSSGFFFGSYDIDEYYYDDLEKTVEIIEHCLKSKFDYFEYQASW